MVRSHLSTILAPMKRQNKVYGDGKNEDDR